MFTCVCVCVYLSYHTTHTTTAERRVEKQCRRRGASSGQKTKRGIGGEDPATAGIERFLFFWFSTFFYVHLEEWPHHSCVVHQGEPELNSADTFTRSLDPHNPHTVWRFLCCFTVMFFTLCISHIVQLTPQQQSAESRNSAGAEALAVARRPKEIGGDDPATAGIERFLFFWFSTFFLCSPGGVATSVLRRASG